MNYQHMGLPRKILSIKTRDVIIRVEFKKRGQIYFQFVENKSVPFLLFLQWVPSKELEALYVIQGQTTFR
jgi:hypothetical protein